MGMNLKLSKLTVENFVVFHDRTVIEFSSSINNIEGIYYTDTKQSNGAGKSLIIDGISLALFGKGIRASYLTDYISTSNPTGGIYIGLELVDESGKILKIERWRRANSETNKAKLWYDGMCISKDSTITRTDELLQTYIGVTHVNFTSCIFSVMIPGFLKLRPAQRFEVLEQALAVKKVDSVIKKINTLIKTEEDIISSLTTTINDKVSTLATERAKQQIYETNSSLIEANIKEKQNELSILFSKEKSKLFEISKLVELRDEITQKLSPETELYSKLYANNSSLELSRTTLINKLNTTLKAFKTNSTGSMECAICRSPLDAHNKEFVTKHYTDEIDALTLLIDENKLLLDACIDKVSKLTATKNKVTTALDVSTKTLSSVIRPSIMVCERSIQESTEAMESGTTFNPVLLTTLQQEIQELTNSKQETKKLLTMSCSWKQALSKNGLRLAYIKQEIATLSAIATSYLSAIYGSPIPVVFFIDEEKDSPCLEFTVNGSNASLMSTGEQRRIEIAMTLSMFSLLKSSGLSLGFLLLDEMLDGLSETSKTNVLKVIDSISTEYQLLVISHDPSIKQRAGKLIQVIKDSSTNRSTICYPAMV